MGDQIVITEIITDEELDKIFLMISRNVRYYRLYNHSRFADSRGRITQERLAELCNVSQSLIANIESEKVKQSFSISVIASISKVLEIPLEEFFKEHERWCASSLYEYTMNSIYESMLIMYEKLSKKRSTNQSFGLAMRAVMKLRMIAPLIPAEVETYIPLNSPKKPHSWNPS